MHHAPNGARFCQMLTVKEDDLGRRWVRAKFTKYDANGIVRGQNFMTKITFARLVTQILATNTQFVSTFNPVLAARLAALGLPTHDLWTPLLRYSQVFRDTVAVLAEQPEVMHVGKPASAGGKELDTTNGRYYQLAYDHTWHMRFDVGIERLRTQQCREREAYRRVYVECLVNGAQVI